jgi:hypothetical protein
LDEAVPSEEEFNKLVNSAYAQTLLAGKIKDEQGIGGGKNMEAIKEACDEYQDDDDVEDDEEEENGDDNHPNRPALQRSNPPSVYTPIVDDERNFHFFWSDEAIRQRMIYAAEL